MAPGTCHDAYRRSDLQLRKTLLVLGPKPSSAGLLELVQLRRFRRAPQLAMPLLSTLQGFPWQGLTLLKALQLHQVEIDIFHVNTVLDICSKAGAWALSLVSATKAAADMELDTVSFGSLTHACAFRGHWMQACDVVEFMRAREQVPNLITYRSLLHGLASARRWSSAMLMLQTLQHHGTKPNEKGYSSAVSACVGRWPQALQLLRPEPSIFEVNGVISACEKGGLWDLALWILFAMPSKFKATPDTISYSSAISACATRGLWEKALHLLVEMTSQRVAANDISFNGVLGACKEDGRWAEALSLLSIMKDSKHLPDVVSFGSAISACDVAGAWEAAFHLLTIMERQEVAPNILCFSGALLSLRGAWHRGARRVWRMATALMRRMAVARVAMDVAWWKKAC